MEHVKTTEYTIVNSLPHDDLLSDWVGVMLGIRGCIWLYNKFGHEGPQQKDMKIQYVIVHAYTSYNILLGRPSLNALSSIVFTLHMAIKFPTDIESIITIHAD